MNAGASTLNVAALAALERAINAALGMDDATREQVNALAGKVFCIDCSVPALRAYIAPEADGVRLYSHYEGAVSCTVSGAGSDFVALAGALDKASALVNGNLRISGDSAPLQADRRQPKAILAYPAGYVVPAFIRRSESMAS